MSNAYSAQPQIQQWVGGSFFPFLMKNSTTNRKNTMLRTKLEENTEHNILMD